MIEAMKQALEALEHTLSNSIWRDQTFEAITALRQAIAEAEKQEPVAWMYDQAKYYENDLRGRQWAFNCFSRNKPFLDNNMVQNVTPLYTHPPKREPLSDEAVKLRGEIGVLVGLLGSALQVIDTVDGEDAAECNALMELYNKIKYAIEGAST